MFYGIVVLQNVQLQWDTRMVYESCLQEFILKVRTRAAEEKQIKMDKGLLNGYGF